MPQWRTAGEIVRGTSMQLRAALAARDDRSEILVVERNSEPAGFAWVLLVADFYTKRDVCKISEIAVARDGDGCGSALMRACEEWARARGCDLMVLNVMEENRHARRFYERHGYAPEYTMLAKRIATDDADGNDPRGRSVAAD